MSNIDRIGHRGYSQGKPLEATNVNVHLTPELEQLVQTRVKSGRYNSASEVVREAQQRGPQRVTLHGKDAVVIVGVDEFDRLQRPVTGSEIVAVLAA